MICPVCKRDLAPTLSICFACGAMMNDSVREELETKLNASAVPARRNSSELAAIQQPITTLDPPTSSNPVFTVPQTTFKPAPPPAFKPPAERVLSKPVQAKPETSAIAPKQTSPTLVGFQPKNAVIPDWRLQVQNSVRQRATAPQQVEKETSSEERRPFAMNGAAAIKNEPFIDSEVAPHQNPRVANALRRIEESRRAFLPGEPAAKAPPATASASQKNHPFNVVVRTANADQASDGPAMISASPKPILVSTMRIEKKKYDTNKLTPLSADDVPPTSVKTENSEREAERRLAGMEIAEENEPARVEMSTSAAPNFVDSADADDLAPLPMRFNAALFDVIIGGFLGLALLSPFILSGGDWVSLPGILAVSGGVFIMLFLYLTISLGVYGQTFGMRLFALELIDADENEYPTLHQAAVHSAVFILSLAGAGLGFLPIFFNEERRAAHDLVSGTVLVKEY